MRLATFHGTMSNLKIQKLVEARRGDPTRAVQLRLLSACMLYNMREPSVPVNNTVT